MKNAWIRVPAILGSIALGATLLAENPRRIVVLGDSITSGYGIDPSAAYPGLLQREIDRAGLPFQVANAGVSGDTTAGGLRRVDWALGDGAAVLVVALGGNDGLRGVSTQQTADNLRAIIRRAEEKSPGIRVLLAGMRMPDSMGREFVERFAAIYPEVARTTGATLIPFLLEGVGGDPELNQPDQIHPTEAGQKRIARTVWAALRPVLEQGMSPEE